MIRIQIPDNFIAERQYILSVIFDTFLGLETKIEINNCKNYTICFDNEKSIIIEDYFWGNLNENESYIDIKNIPTKISFLEHNGLKIPIIYGKNIIQSNGKTTIIKADIFASAFFMLSRWEEIAITERDKFDRFLSKNALAVKFGFINRPVVQEYLDLLISYFPEIEKTNIKKRKFQILATHDIDLPKKWSSIFGKIKTLAADILLRQSLQKFIWSFSAILKNEDPYNKINYLIDTSNKFGIRSRFYFLFSSENLSKHSRCLKQYAKIIKQTKHEIGIHPDFGSYLNNDFLQKQIKDFQKYFEVRPINSRQHYLQLSVNSTFEQLDKLGIKTDSSLYYTDTPGFRTGSCYEFPIFDLKARKKLEIVEQNLSFMDQSALFAETKEKAFETICDIIKQIKKHQGQFIILWHNSNFDPAVWHDFQGLYEDILRFASK